MLINNLPALQVVIPLIAALLCVIISNRRICWLISICAVFISGAIAITLLYKTFFLNEIISYVMGGWQAPFGIEYRVDKLSALMLVLVTTIAIITMLYGYNSNNREIPHQKQPLFYCIFLLCFSGLIGITISNDAFNIYVFLEISSLATYTLIAMGKDRRALAAAFEYLILGTIGATFILIAVGLLYMMTGTLNISDLSQTLPGLYNTIPIKAALAFFIIGLILKIAMFPLHLWLTNAYSNAPSFVASFLSATATKVNIYVLIRVAYSLFSKEFAFDEIFIDKIITILSLFAIVIGALVASLQQNIRRMLAYSSVSQIGYIMLALSLTNQTGLTAALSHVINHAFAKAALFMAAGCILYRMGSTKLTDLHGVGKIMPWTMAGFTLSGLSLIGVPLTAGFISKWYILQAIFEEKTWYIFIVVIFSSLAALLYIWRVVEVAYFKSPSTSSSLVPSSEKINEVPMLMLIALWIAVFITMILGIYTYPNIDLTGQTAEYLFQLTDEY